MHGHCESHGIHGPRQWVQTPGSRLVWHVAGLYSLEVFQNAPLPDCIRRWTFKQSKYTSRVVETNTSSNVHVWFMKCQPFTVPTYNKHNQHASFLSPGIPHIASTPQVFSITQRQLHCTTVPLNASLHQHAAAIKNALSEALLLQCCRHLRHADLGLMKYKSIVYYTQPTYMYLLHYCDFMDV